MRTKAEQARQAPRVEQADQEARTDALRDVGPVKRWDQRWVPERTDSNGVVFGSTTEAGQTHERLVLEAPAEILCLPPCRIAGLTIVTGPFSMRGAFFTGPVSVPVALAVQAFFVDCVFMQPITMAAAKASFIGCTFQGTASVIHAGIAADIGIIGCTKTSAPAHVNVTVVYQN